MPRKKIKKTTVADVWEEALMLQEQLAIWQSASEFLQQFLPSDSFRPRKGILVPGRAEVVRPETLEKVQDDIEKIENRITSKLAALQKKNVTTPRRKANARKTKKR